VRYCERTVFRDLMKELIKLREEGSRQGKGRERNSLREEGRATLMNAVGVAG